MSTIELLAAEVSYFKSESQALDSNPLRGSREPIGPWGSEDDLIERHRRLEEVLSHFVPQTDCEALVVATVLVERADIVENDHLRLDPLTSQSGELGRLARAVRNYISSAGAGTLERLMATDASASGVGPSLVEALAAELDAVWKEHATADARWVRLAPEEKQASKPECELKRAMLLIRSLELAIAASRLKTERDAAIACRMLVVELDDRDGPKGVFADTARLLAQGLQEYLARNGKPLPEGVLHAYPASHVANPTGKGGGECQAARPH